MIDSHMKRLLWLTVALAAFVIVALALVVFLKPGSEQQLSDAGNWISGIAGGIALVLASVAIVLVIYNETEQKRIGDATFRAKQELEGRAMVFIYAVLQSWKQKGEIVTVAHPSVIHPAKALLSELDSIYENGLSRLFLDLDAELEPSKPADAVASLFEIAFFVANSLRSNIEMPEELHNGFIGMVAVLVLRLREMSYREVGDRARAGRLPSFMQTGGWFVPEEMRWLLPGGASTEPRPDELASFKRSNGD